MNADALSKSPVLDCSVATSQPEVVVAVTVPFAEGESTLEGKQHVDPTLKNVMDYLTLGVLPQEYKHARELVLSKSQYHVIDGVLYRVQPDKTLRIIPPTQDREGQFQEAHGGTFVDTCETRKSTVSWPSTTGGQG